MLVAEWVGDMVARGVSSAATYVAGLNKLQVNSGGRPLRETVAIQQALEGWKRMKPPPKQKQPFVSSMLARVRDQMDPRALLDARNLAMLVVGHGGAFRGESELLAARLPLRASAGGAEVDVHTKTDVNVHTTTARRIPAAGPPGLVPLEVLQRYLQLSGHTGGFVFRNVVGGGARARSNERPVSRSTLAGVVKQWAEVLGCDPKEFSTHSLRHGCAADVKTANVPTAVGMAVMGHASVGSYAGYGGAEAQRRGEAARRRQHREQAAAVAAEHSMLSAQAWSVHQVPPLQKHGLFSVAQALRSCKQKWSFS
jgi:hypothetical protein